MVGRWSVALLLAFLLGTGVTESPAQEAVVLEPPEELREHLELSSFYKKCLSTRGFPIVSSEKVSDFAFLEAAYIVNSMLADRDDLRQAMVKNKVRLAIMATQEFTCDLPECSDLRPKEFWNVRARGYGPIPGRPVIVCGEENLLVLRGDPYPTENTLVHELGHAIHTMGLPSVDPEFEVRLKSTFEAAKSEGLWKETYAMTNEREYWAEGVQCWFNTQGLADRLHNIINTRSRLKHYDPRLAGLLEEAFPKNDWKYSRPDKRSKIGHLNGFDPLTAPRFEWPVRMLEDYRRYQARQKKDGQIPTQSVDYFPR